MLKYIFIAFAVFAAFIVLFINKNLAALAESFYTGSLWWAHGTLLFMEAVAFLGFWRGIAGGRRHLVLLHDERPDARERFAKELVRRMGSNPYVREAGIVPDGPEDAERIAECIALLRTKADAEIKENAKRVFLATALSQNGRLDALIVFFSLCRLVWRIASIYNQRPHPREIVSLYWAVLTSAFLALSLEELDLTTEISVGFGKAFHGMIPAGLTASIPFAGRMLQTFTASLMDGSANCYLALRTGIIARNAYDYALALKPRPSRADVFREAGALLIAMSASLVDRLTGGFAAAVAEAAKIAQDKTIQASKDIVQGIGRLGGDMGASIADAGSAVTDAAAGVVDAVGTVTRSAVRVAADAGSVATDAAAKPFSWIFKKKARED